MSYRTPQLTEPEWPQTPLHTCTVGHRSAEYRNTLPPVSSSSSPDHHHRRHLHAPAALLPTWRDAVARGRAVAAAAAAGSFTGVGALLRLRRTQGGGGLRRWDADRIRDRRRGEGLRDFLRPESLKVAKNWNVLLCNEAGWEKPWNSDFHFNRNDHFCGSTSVYSVH